MTDTIFSQRAKPAKGAAKGQSTATKAAKPTKAAKTESPSLVDPRLQARRIEVARGQGRRRLRWVVAAAVVVALVAGAFALVQSPVLDVDRIDVRGAAETDQAAVVAASGIRLGTALASLDAPAAERRLEALPWIERATVSRSWPGTVEIALIERTPVAVVGTGSDAVRVDRHGRALGPAGGSDLPVIGGDPVAAGEQLSSSQRWVAATVADLPKALRGDVAHAVATPSGIRLDLDDGITVRWGDRSQPSAKADAVEVLLEQADRTTIDTIDVSVPRAATVTRS